MAKDAHCVQWGSPNHGLDLLRHRMTHTGIVSFRQQNAPAGVLPHLHAQRQLIHAQRLRRPTPTQQNGPASSVMAAVTRGLGTQYIIQVQDTPLHKLPFHSSPAEPNAGGKRASRLPAPASPTTMLARRKTYFSVPHTTTKPSLRQFTMPCMRRWWLGN